MDEIKSAYEIAMERVKKLGEATDEERLKWKYIPEGEKLAAKYLKQESELSELAKYDAKVAKHVKQGVSDILIRNITLPRDEIAKRATKRAMDGLKEIKKDRVAIENVYSKIRRIFSHYADQGEQQRIKAYQTLKADFEARIQQAVQQQMGTAAGINIDVEKQPQFQEEWHKVKTQLDSQYIKLLDEYKQELTVIE